MQVAAYIHANRIQQPTGVGKHIVQMVSGLAATPGMDVSLLAPAGDINPAGRLTSAHGTALEQLPAKRLPGSRAVLEYVWFALNAPAIDRWSGNADWIYLPAEAYVSARATPVAVTVHDLWYLERHLQPTAKNRLNRGYLTWKLKLARMAAHVRLFLTVSGFTKSRMIELLGIKPERIAVVGNGVDDVYFQQPAEPPPAVAPAVPDHPYLFVSGGGLTHKKGAPYLLAFARMLAQVRPEMKILVTGGGSDLDYASQAEAVGNIVRLGYVQSSRQLQLLRGAYASLTLSLYEGFGIPVLEAMAVGTPAIASSFAALPETVASAGLVVDATRPQAIMDAVQALEHQPTRADYIHRGRLRAAQFRWSNAVAKLAAALHANR